MATQYHPLQSIIHFVSQRSLWSVISIGIVVAVALLSPQERLTQLNRLVQDFAIASHERAVEGDVVIVAIDDESIAQLGRWPWRRTLHAELLDRISADQPKVIGLDVLFTEAEQTYVHDDAMLAAAIKRSAPVVLPVFVQSQGSYSHVITPLPAIASGAKALGQAHIKVDDDGVVRSIYLWDKLDGVSWDHFSVAMLKAAGQPLQIPDLTTLDIKNSDHQNLSKTHENWIHQHPMIVPFSGGSGHFERISYLDVIQGIAPTDTFKDKYVLVGATAAGIADQYATPTSGKSYLMPGVEILANIMDGLLHHIRIEAASPLQNVLLNLAFVAAALIGFVLLRPFSALLLTILLAISLLAVSYFSVGMVGILFSPAAGILGLIFIYPLWSWHRLSTAARYLTAEFESLQQEKSLFFAPNKKPLVKDFLDRRISALEGATRQLQILHRFVTDSINNLPYPTLICGVDGVIRIANLAATQHFKVASTQELVNQFMPSLIADVLSNQHHLPMITQASLGDHYMPLEGEAKDSLGRELIVKCVPIFNPDNLHAGWILTLVDVSKMRLAERDREEAFRFITHDIRSPLSSIISVLELSRLEPQKNQQSHESLMQRLERHAENALLLADNFVNLARAKSGEYHFESLDLCGLLSEVVDEAWSMAHRHSIKIEMVTDEDNAYAMVDRNMFKRALTNLLSNAIKFSAANSQIICSVSNKSGYWDIATTDHGAGIPPEVQMNLFQPFNRLHAQSHPEIEGTGLGLAFVYSVAQRHNGKVEVESKLNEGSTFHLLIPHSHA